MGAVDKVPACDKVSACVMSSVWQGAALMSQLPGHLEISECITLGDRGIDIFY